MTPKAELVQGLKDCRERLRLWLGLSVALNCYLAAMLLREWAR